MRIARNHEAALIYCENLDELEALVNALRPLTNPVFPVPVFVGDRDHRIKVHSLKGLVVTIRLEDIEEM